MPHNVCLCGPRGTEQVSLPSVQEPDRGSWVNTRGSPKLARILLAEDYDDLRDMISELLKQQAHVVEAFDNGLDAAETLKNHSFDLLILDWELPRLQGVDVIKDYRAAGGTSPV